MSPQPISSTTAPTALLLQLPPEIRNKIFEYALTSSAPLHHQPPPLSASPTMYIESRRPKHPKLVEAKHFEKVQIRRYLEFNQLKFVNKQLYAETAGLEIQFNMILFSAQPVRYLPTSPNQAVQRYPPFADGHQHNSAEHWFLDFIAPMKTQKISWLTTVIIHSREKKCFSYKYLHGPPIPELPALVRFCKEHTDVKVRYQFDDWKVHSLATIEFVSIGTSLIAALKTDKVGQKFLRGFHWNAQQAQIHFQEAQHWRESWNIRDLLEGVSNFAFWPTINTQVMESHPLVHAAAAPNHDQGTEIWDRDRGVLLWNRCRLLWIEHGINAAGDEYF